MAGLDDDSSKILALVYRVAGSRDLRFTLKQVGGGAAKVAGSTAVFGLALGPIGLLVGGIVGSVVAYASSKEYKSLVSILNEMQPAQRAQFARLCLDAGRELFNITATIGLLSLEEDKVVQIIEAALRMLTEGGH